MFPERYLANGTSALPDKEIKVKMSSEITFEITAVHSGGLYALQTIVPLSGNVSAYARDTTGFASYNAYLIVEDARALLIDTGFAAARLHLLAALRSLIPPGAKLAVFPLRLGEFDSVSNVRAVIEEFDVDVLYGIQDHGERWIDFIAGDAAVRRHPLEYVKIGRTGTIPLGKRREISVVAPEFRLLQTHWLFDDVSRTLFTSDAFSHLSRPSRSGPWMTKQETLDVVQMRNHLVKTRYWWLPGAIVDTLVSDIDGIFSNFSPNILAPAYGSIIQGEDLVNNQKDEVINILSEESKKSIQDTVLDA